MCMNKLSTSQLRRMIGCGVSYRGREGTIEGILPDAERRGQPSLVIRMSDTDMVAVIRPSELAP